MDSASTDSIIYEAIEEVSEREDTDPTELNPPIQEVIDVDALENLLQNPKPGSSIRVSFVYQGYEVTLTTHGISEIVALD
ncbi:HalOD1 output domain-containing protein [Halorubrum sp. F4]|uniref:HalOD1 output domain-containing protein n=1 Tax=Halorubrum sp. F4 TaxID=2989715 RepID=UPI002480E03E|nr:HalOD1 output domain-containing protein [Halorubrum sp. F4]